MPLINNDYYYFPVEKNENRFISCILKRFNSFHFNLIVFTNSDLFVKLNLKNNKCSSKLKLGCRSISWFWMLHVCTPLSQILSNSFLLLSTLKSFKKTWKEESWIRQKSRNKEGLATKRWKSKSWFLTGFCPVGDRCLFAELKGRKEKKTENIFNEKKTFFHKKNVSPSQLVRPGNWKWTRSRFFFCKMFIFTKKYGYDYFLVKKRHCREASAIVIFVYAFVLPTLKNIYFVYCKTLF